MSKIVLAFSGGLDTTFCAIWLREQTGAEIVTVCVDTGGFTDEELTEIAAHAQRLGVSEHRTVDAKQVVYDRFVAYLIKGNCLRGGVYPVSVGAERTAQAEAVVAVAREVGATGVSHGSTKAGKISSVKFLNRTGYPYSPDCTWWIKRTFQPPPSLVLPRVKRFMYGSIATS